MSLMLLSKEFEKIGRTNILDKDAAYDFLFSNNLLANKGNQFLQTQQKFENFLIVNVMIKIKKVDL